MSGRLSSRLPSIGTLFLAGLGLANTAHAAGEQDVGLFHFVTRPDIKAPKWNVQIYEEAALADGYWFLGPYKALNQPKEAGDDGWIGPTIYTDDGELVWSGATMFGNHNIEDFRISNVRGEQLMTLMHQQDFAGYIINNDFTIRKKVDEVRNNNGNINTHEFHFVENGTEAIVIKTDFRDASKEKSKAVYDGICKDVHWDKFEVLDSKTWKLKFSWSSEDHIGLDESTLDDSSIERRCGGGWDYAHANSVDKTPEGNYLISVRHTDTLYYIDGESGDVIWRLGGRKSDFEVGEDVKFSRQHHIRWRGTEGNKMWITILDNAKGMDTQEPTYPMSRGLRLVLDTEAMTAEVDLQIDHPDGPDNYAPRRGNYQVLPNDNIFMDWSEKSIQSEHAPDGKILMEARLKAEWLGTYRSYKYPFVGKPADPPDVVSVAETRDHTMTVVYVSWNGATEVVWWNTYSTNASGKNKTLIGTTLKTGFETEIGYASFAKYVVVEGLDEDFNVLGESKVVKTEVPEGVNATKIAEEMNMSEEAVLEDDDDYSTAALFGAIVALAVVGFLGFAVLLVFRWKGVATPFNLGSWKYHEVKQDEDAKLELNGQRRQDEEP